MRALVNALALPSFRQGGAGYYTSTLIEGLATSGTSISVGVLVSRALEAELNSLAPNASAETVESVSRSPIRKAVNYGRACINPEHLNLGFSTRQVRQPEVVHWPISFMHGPPVARNARRVLTVLDLQQEFYPEFFSRKNRLLRRTRWPRSARAADHVIAISEFTKRTVCDRYGVAGNRVTVIPLAPRKSFLRALGSPPPALPPRLETASSWFLYPASPLPAKNHARLLNAFQLHRERVDPDAQLVLTGPRLHSWTAVERAVTEMGLEGAVLRLGHVTDPELYALYAGCTGLIFPSLFEGFGLPVLEAMVVGCPIAVSQAGSLPEVVGDAGHRFSADDVDEIADALAWLASLGDHARTSAVSAGRCRAELFSTENMIASTLQVYQRVVDQ